MKDLTPKVVLLGDGAVGKTSLVQRFVEQRFEDKYIETIGVNVKKREIEDLEMTMMVWDIYGQKVSKSLHSSNYTGADGAIIVYDVTRKETFESLDQWIDDVFSVTGKIPITVLGNKYDLMRDFDIYQEDRSKSNFQKFMDDEHEEVIEFYDEVYDEVPEFERVKYDVFLRWGEEKEEELGSEFSYFMSSAKTGKNVEDAFHTLGEMILEGDDDE